MLTLEKKVQLVERMEKGESRAKLMAGFGVSSSTLYDLKKQKEKLKAFMASTDAPSSNLAKRKSLKGARLSELDRALYIWFSARRAENKPVSGPIIIEKAQKLYEDLGIEEECSFSTGWLRNFKCRHGIREIHQHGEKNSADHEAAAAYTEEFMRLIREHDVSCEQVYNADETALFWRCVPTSTLSTHDEARASGFKVNKDRITVLPCANVAGTHKLKLFVLGKFKKPRAFKDVVHFPVHYDANANAWMTAVLFKWWFFHCFVPEVKEHLRQQDLPEDSKVILLLDNCRAHPPAQELVSGNIFVVYLPPNVTSLIQPMDQGVIQNFKHFYRSGFLRKLVNAECDVPAFQSTFNLKDAIYAAALAWKDVKKTTIRNCWRKLWPLNIEEDGFEGFEERDPDDVAIDYVARLRALASHAPASHPIHAVQEGELEEWMELDASEPIVEELTDEAIVSMLRTPPPVVPEHESDAEEEEVPKVTWKEAQTGLEAFVKFVETSSYYNQAEVMSCHILYNAFLTKKASSWKQADLRQLFAQAARRSAASTAASTAAAAVVSSPSDADDPSPMAESPSPKAGCSRTLDFE